MSEILTFRQALEEIADRAGGRRDVLDRMEDALDQAQMWMAQTDIEFPRLECQRAWRTQSYRQEYFLGRDLGIRDLIGIRHMRIATQDSSYAPQVLLLTAAPDGGQRAIALDQFYSFIGQPMSREVHADVFPPRIDYFTEDMGPGLGEGVDPVQPLIPQPPLLIVLSDAVRPSPLQDEYDAVVAGTITPPTSMNGIYMTRFPWADYRSISSQSQSAPVQWTTLGQVIALDPMPNSVYPILMDYRRQPKKGELEISAPWLENLLTLAMHIVWKQLQEYQLAQSQMQLLPMWMQIRLNNPNSESDWAAANDGQFGVWPA